jgi:hypothetical protein
MVRPGFDHEFSSCTNTTLLDKSTPPKRHQKGPTLPACQGREDQDQDQGKGSKPGVHRALSQCVPSRKEQLIVPHLHYRSPHRQDPSVMAAKPATSIPTLESCTIGVSTSSTCPQFTSHSIRFTEWTTRQCVRSDPRNNDVYHTRQQYLIPRTLHHGIPDKPQQANTGSCLVLTT